MAAGRYDKRDDRIRELERQLSRAVRERDDLAATVRKLEASTTDALASKLHTVLSDDDAVEMYRGNAWIAAKGYMGLPINDATGEFQFPDGWPEGLEPERFIADKLGLLVERVVPKPEAPPAPANGANGAAPAGLLGHLPPETAALVAKLGGEQ